MARGDKNYKEVVRKVNKGNKSKEKVAAVHKMVEALIAGDVDTAVEESKTAMQLIVQNHVLGEMADDDKKDEKDDDKKDDDKDDDDKDDDKKSKKSKKPKKGVNPFAKKDDDDDDDDDDKDDDKKDLKEENLTKSKAAKWLPSTDRKVHGRSLKDKPHTANDTKATKVKKLPGADKGGVKGNVYKKKPHKANDTQAKPVKKLPGTKDKVHGKYDDDRDYEMGTGNV